MLDFKVIKYNSQIPPIERRLMKGLERKDEFHYGLWGTAQQHRPVAFLYPKKLSAVHGEVGIQYPDHYRGSVLRSHSANFLGSKSQIFKVILRVLLNFFCL